MLDEKNVYALDSGKNSFLTMTKEQILTAITQAVNEGTIGDIDAGFITKIQEQNDQKGISFWFGTTAQFEALEEKREDILYILTDDTTLTDIETGISDANKYAQAANQKVDLILTGVMAAKIAELAYKANEAKSLKGVIVTDDLTKVGNFTSYPDVSGIKTGLFGVFERKAGTTNYAKVDFSLEIVFPQNMNQGDSLNFGQLGVIDGHSWLPIENTKYYYLYDDNDDKMGELYITAAGDIRYTHTGAYTEATVKRYINGSYLTILSAEEKQEANNGNISE